MKQKRIAWEESKWKSDFSEKADVDDLVSKDALPNDFQQGKINVNLSNFNDRKKVNAFLSYCENWLIISTINQANIFSSHLSKFTCKF